MSDIKITFGDGKKGRFKQGATLLEAVRETYQNTYRDFIVARHNGRLVDLNTPLEDDVQVELLTGADPEGMHVFWHSASHIMAQAVKSLYSDVKLGIGPSIDSGFYYDFSLKDSLSADDFSKIEAKIAEIVSSDQPFRRRIFSKKDALAFFHDKNESFKEELIADLPDDVVTAYENDDFIDLCRGPHVPSTGYIKYLKLLSVAGAYWHGDERNPVMQRIYGIAFPQRKALAAHIQQIEEAKKRDHRKLGKELDLFSFHQEGPGFPFWHPNGVIVYNQVQQFMREVLYRRNYQEILTPVILNEELWHRSGHWDNYKDNMYFTSIDDQGFALKPMNCPGGVLIYKNTPHSYRDLPRRISEMGLVHRHEKSGVLHGLFRVRAFTQDDAHVFCTPDQLEAEIIDLIDLVEEVYKTFGYDQYQIELSTRPSKSIGNAEMWKKAESALADALQKKSISYQVNEGEGAFYGPKIDYHIQDSLGRLWQCGTIQVDFSMPERFDLEYVGSDGENHRPVMLHRAILGSVERFIGILIEHVGGAFPLWLAPVQCILLPIGEKHQDNAKKVADAITQRGIRCRIDERNEKIGYKIRDAETKKIPFMGIIGDKEVDTETLSVRQHKKGDLGSKPLKDFIEFLRDQIDRRTYH